MTDRTTAHPASDPTEASSKTPAGVPSDNATISGAVSSLDEEGFDGQFVPEESASLACSQCGASIAAERLDVRYRRRFEGASDPDDMAMMIAAVCPACGAGGTFVLGYGINASDLDADITSRLVVSADTEASAHEPDA